MGARVIQQIQVCPALRASKQAEVNTYLCSHRISVPIELGLATMQSVHVHWVPIGSTTSYHLGTANFLRTYPFTELLSVDGGARWNVANRPSWLRVVL